MDRIILALVASVAMSAALTTARAADLEAAAPHGLFGSLMGSYTLKANEDWQIFPDGYFGADPLDEAGLDDGGLFRGLIGYRWSNWDAAIGLQYGKFSSGDPSDPLEPTGTLSARMWALDAQLGYNTMMGDAALRLAGGLRYADWNNDVDAYGDRINHDFSGLGPMLRADLSKPFGDRTTLETGAGVGVLFGKIKTNATSGWNCADCTNDNTTALVLEGNLGMGFNLGAARAVAGWQAQWWDGVNVNFTDISGAGDNDGKSGHLLTGPYLEVKF